MNLHRYYNRHGKRWVIFTLHEVGDGEWIVLQSDTGLSFIAGPLAYCLGLLEEMSRVRQRFH